MKTLNIDYSRKGFDLMILRRLVLLAILIIAAFVFGHYGAAQEQAELPVKEACRTMDYYLGHNCYEDFGRNWWNIAMLATFVLSALLVIGLLFSSREEDLLTGNDDGRWSSVGRRCSYLFGTVDKSRTFDEITYVEVSQGPLERACNIGTISMTLVKYLGPSSRDTTSWVTSGVEDPHQVKALIMESLPPPKGLSLHLLPGIDAE